MPAQDDIYLYDLVMESCGARQASGPTKGFRHVSELKYDDLTFKSKQHLEACGFSEIFYKEIDVLGNNILQSPLERSIICHLRTENYCGMLGINDICILLPGEKNSFLEERICGVVITPQAQVGPYSLDFGLSVKSGSTIFNIDVECDGYEFHSSSRDALDHDIKRDEYMSALGYAVIRLSGVEINRNPLMATQRVTEGVGLAIQYFREHAS